MSPKHDITFDDDAIESSELDSLPRMGDHIGPEEPLLGNRPRHDNDADDILSGDETDSTSKSVLDPESQEGVQRADAVNIVWTRSALILTYCFIFLNFCLHSMEAQTSSNLMPYVVSDFSAHSLIPAVGITSFVLSGVLKLPTAKMIDIWGRPQGLVVMTLLGTIGLLLMAVCRDVKTYAAAKIFHGVGASGFAYILEIIIADTSSLRDRALALTFVGSPFLATTFLGPYAAQWFLRYSSWRMSFAVFAILTPVVAAPVFCILQFNARKAKRLGVLKEVPSGRTWQEALRHYAVEFDGMLDSVFSPFDYQV